MKKIFLVVSFFVTNYFAGAQSINDILKKVTKKDSSGKSILDNVTKTLPPINSALSNEDIINGLKDALRVGTDSSSKKLSKLDGFFTDAAIKILMPTEAQKVEKTLRNVGMGKLVDKAVLSMNRAAEDAASGIGNIFWNSIKAMTINDGLKILQGNDFAATEYLKKASTAELTEKFKPVIEAALKKVDATKHWTAVFTSYNRFSKSPVNTDLNAYVTEKALSGLFYNIGLQEQKIRKDPAAQVTDILKKVFGKK
jgi:Protein of unknown function (DUF4197)